MLCANNTSIIGCGSKHQIVQDCVDCNWLVYNQTPSVIFEANKIVSASGTIHVSSMTVGMSKVDVIFSKGTNMIKTFTLENHQCLSFTVVGFNAITLKGNSSSATESASGSISLTPRYQM